MDEDVEEDMGEDIHGQHTTVGCWHMFVLSIPSIIPQDQSSSISSAQTCHRSRNAAFNRYPLAVRVRLNTGSVAGAVSRFHAVPA